MLPAIAWKPGLAYFSATHIFHLVQLHTSRDAPPERTLQEGIGNLPEIATSSSAPGRENAKESCPALGVPVPGIPRSSL